MMARCICGHGRALHDAGQGWCGGVGGCSCLVFVASVPMLAAITVLRDRNREAVAGFRPEEVPPVASEIVGAYLAAFSVRGEGDKRCECERGERTPFNCWNCSGPVGSVGGESR